MRKKQDWMPVFVVTPTAVSLHAAHPHHRGKVPKGPQTIGADFEQRIGTAVRQKDGGFALQLTAIPVNGKLWMRPARAGEHLDPTGSNR